MKEGIITGSIDYKEKSKIIYILTESGKDSLLVHNAKDPKNQNNNLTQILNCIQYESVGKGSLNTASLIDIVDYNFVVKEDIKKYALISFVLEAINNYVIEGASYQVLYRLIKKFIDEVTKRNDYLMLLLEIKIKLLYFFGIAPNFRCCGHCNTTKNLVGLSIKNGFVECNDHRSEDNIGASATKILEMLYLDKTFNIQYDDEEIIKYLYGIVTEYYNLHLGINFKSDKMLKELKII